MPFFAAQPKAWHMHLPDLVEERGDRVLLVWGDVPYWTVMDREFFALLSTLDGKQDLEAVLRETPAWHRERKAILRQLAVLQRAGVVSGGQIARTAETAPRIENIALNLTRRCNLRCKFCYNLPYLTKDAAGEVSAEEILGFLRQARPLLGPSPTLTILGGEPLLEPEKLLAVSTGAARLGMGVLVSTNGTRVADDFPARARAMRLQVQVSLDGHTPALNDRMRGKGSFDRAVAGIRALVSGGVHTIVSLVCHQGNVEHLEDFYDLVLTLGAREARFIPLKRLGGAADGAFTPVPLDVLLRRAFDLFTRRPELLRLAGRDAFAILAHTCRYSYRRTSCGTGVQTLLLDADGSLYPCLNLNRPEFHLGNIRDAGFNLLSLWCTFPPLAHIREQTAVASTASAHAACPVRAWCLGGCRGENHALTGSLANRPPHCAEQKRAIIGMFWMLAEHPELVAPAIRSC